MKNAVNMQQIEYFATQVVVGLSELRSLSERVFSVIHSHSKFSRMIAISI